MILDARQKEMWRHFWANDVKQRPLLMSQEHRNGKDRNIQGKYFKTCNGLYEQLYKENLAIHENTIYRGESFPTVRCEHGPDAFAAFISGTALKFSSDDKETNWIDPALEDYDNFDFSLKENGPIWKGMVNVSKYFADRAESRYIVATIDLHSNIDALSALRGPQNLCMDLIDCPEKVEESLKKIRALYPVVYNKLYEAGNMGKTGSSGWIPFYCEGKYTVIQADFICMISPEQFDRFAYPALEEEANFLDHCFLHLDGPGALKHLDRILEIKKLDGIQWVSGAGQKPMKEWMEVFRKCRKAGKKLVIYDVTTLDEIKYFTKELGPNGLIFHIGDKTEAEFEEIEGWLVKNT